MILIIVSFYYKVDFYEITQNNYIVPFLYVPSCNMTVGTCMSSYNPLNLLCEVVVVVVVVVNFTLNLLCEVVVVVVNFTQFR